MIRLIAAIDDKRGLGDGKEQPFHIEKDLQRFRDLTWEHTILMGYTTYQIIGALKGRRNVVASRDDELSLPDAEVINDIPQFLANTSEDVWVIGGGKIFEASLDYADELYLTHVVGDFHCTVFFPEYESKFELIQKGDPITENGITFRFNIYKRKT